MTNVILCGGSGTRLWPISRTLMPKQFVKLFENKSLFQLTVERNSNVCDKQLIVSNAEQYFLALDQLEEIGQHNNSYILEPIGRNTAPAIALACMALAPEELVLVSPSDHLIKNETEYKKALQRAQKLAEEDHLVTFGITPHFAETGFGYIEADGENVKAFHEKPDLDTATDYLEAGNYYWNSGMFMFKAGVFLEELEKHSPDIFKASLKAYKNADKKDLVRIKLEDMLAIPENSIDYAVMEKSGNVKVVASDIGWSDLGSFDSLYEELPKDKHGNTLNPNLVSIDSKNNLIYGNERKIATIDIEDTIVVDTGDALLISKKGSSQKVKKVVEEIRKDSELHHIHLTGHRPWGTYTILEEAEGYKIKRIVVKPGKRLSLQKHHHRNEHWIVISGTATVTIGEETKILRPNESTYIKMGEVHRLANDGIIPVVLIEVQVGEYTGEDDIIRIEDDFRRD
ncbi:mannose-1-phosphate guanylyltransferase/mannose-6-phosphate isomerase [Nitratifractor salsuginis]|uniref:mannose-1-phosphate guanylyltransferase n=1 Tax=Nitratifractor salsuginis (strain DSM 16511 / JCM 12458 / E9I37-1) TaxID=749222 RepID=E6WZM8_NITSE|nr:mannose-1-phosphate guanylyltransferase/mannose-6-phosphate isomerase [Nitratifractor salsuginis]ADV46669.1 mannose-1-phosphate guanylyltransferase (GDP); mannose-6-phosphate isomerase, type 2 [Nitratifractor salsuginis DSM 16511]